jgi:hypothetical protein
MAFHGMDMDDIRNRAAHLNVQASDIAGVESTLKAIFDDGSTWVGADAEAAHARLHDQIIPALIMVRTFVEDTARLMSEIADQQENASAAYG